MPSNSALSEELTWREVESALDDGTTVVVAVSSIERYGPHLPLVMDTLTGDERGLRA